MNVDEIKKIQDKFHQRADRKRLLNRIRNPFIKVKEERIAELIANAIKASPGRKVLEIGCGEGANYYHLEKKLPGIQYVGLDCSSEKIDCLLEYFSGVEGVCADALQLPFEATLYDFVLCRDILHHVDYAREEMLKEAIRVLKPNGKLVIFESNGKSIINCIFRLFYQVERGMKESSPEKLRRLCSKYGEVEVDYIEVSFFLRALAFFFGWPEGVLKYAVMPIYGIARVWESLMQRLLPKSRWTYMMVTLSPEVK